MAGTIIRMSKIKQVLRLHIDGVSNRRIAKELRLYKGTVNDYINKVKSNGFEIEALLQLEEPELEKKFSAGNPAYTEARFQIFRDKLPYFEKELERKHVTRHILWEEYIREYPNGYRYTQFCHHLKQIKTARHPSAVLSHAPAHELHVDFSGDTMCYIDRETGEIIEVQVFIACLPYSDYTFMMAVRSQTTEDFLYALSCALRHFGGSPKILVPDNLKAAVIKADKYEPELNRFMEDFGNHYNFVTIPARPYHPKDKATVENHVKITYTRVYAKLRNETFFSIEELNKAIRAKIKDHNQTRMQQKPYSREEKFLAEEKSALMSLPETDFEVKYYTDLKVAHNNCIYLGRDKHYYSVHHSYTGRKVSVIYTRTIVRIYCDGSCIATHPRDIGYGYTIQKEHLCSTHRHYADRSPDYYIKLAGKRSESLEKLIIRNFEKEEIPERIYRRCDGLMSMQRKTDPVIFEKARLYAVDNDLLSCKSLQKIIENKAYEMAETELEKNEAEAKTKTEKRPSHENIRGKKYFNNHLKTMSLWNKSDLN